MRPNHDSCETSVKLSSDIIISLYVCEFCFLLPLMQLTYHPFW
jgi:hypothetical protein